MSEEEPLFRVVRGVPTAEELAALVGVIVTRSRPPAPVRSAGTPAWVRLARPGMVSPSGLPGRPGGDAWRISALPR
jgi:hypothetical protein